MKRLHSRIGALEQRQGTDSPLTSPSKTLLVQLLAKLHALFWPHRVTITIQPPIPEIRARQREYLAGVAGLPWKADGRHDWKSASELRSSLVASGHLQAVSSSGQIQSLMLTPLGLETATRLVGSRLASAEEARICLEIVRSKIRQYGWPIREGVLFGIPAFGNPENWQEHIELVLPLLTAGVLRCDSDTQGRILFTLADGVELPEPVAVDATEEEWADEIYLKAFNNERHVLANADPRDVSEVYIPVGASDAWPKMEDDTDEK
jgi:hypothetical protein